MSDAKKGDGKGAEAPPKEKGGSKLVPILIGVNSLLVVGVMAFLVMQMQKQQQAMTAALAGLSSHAPAAAGDAPAGEAGGHAAEPAGGEPAAHGEEAKADPHGGGGEKGAAAPGAGKPVMAKLPDFVVHLRNPDADRYARMSFDVEVVSDSDKERIDAAMPKVRDAFISYLSDRTLEDLRGSEGLARTKDSLQTMLRQVVPEARIRALYISDFVVQ
jgi:flagellar FliL protein